ncbi:MAG: threonine aldolase family protein [Campylobacteraceae bacterium]
MYSFKDDYSEGAHPNILDKLLQTNLTQQLSYGEDEYSKSAKEILKNKISNQNATIYFVTGGTTANLLVISSLLKSHEAVISANSGHIATHEAGAIEATGHKIIEVKSNDGKLTLLHVKNALIANDLRPHAVKPKMVYISNSTEIGTIYTKNELEELYAFCKKNDLLLFLDGARLGAALTSKSCGDIALQDIAKNTDVFYIGGTKNGALLGEAIIFKDNSIAPEFDYHLKQKGALLAKGRLLGIQFLELFRDDLYFTLAKKANSHAVKIEKVFKEKGFSFLTDSPTNQIFPILPKELIKKLQQKYSFYEWQPIDDNLTAIRIMTSWTTDETKVDEFIKDVKTFI